MVGRSVDKNDEIRAYIKARSKLGCSLKKLMTEISTAFGPSCVSYDTVRRWKKKFESGVESIKNAPKSGRPKSASRKEIVSKIKEIIEGDARFTVRDIARKEGISLSTVHLILKKHLKVRKISARWVPHLLTDEQKRQRVKVAKKLLQMFPKYDKKQFANVVTGDETWVHYFEPVRKVSNKIWATIPPYSPDLAPCDFFLFPKLKAFPCWAEIPVPTGTWICHSSVPYYCAQISVPWRLQEVDTSAKTLHF